MTGNGDHPIMIVLNTQATNCVAIGTIESTDTYGFNIYHTASGAQNLSFTDAVEQYAVTGGVPKYLEFFEDDKTLIEQIKNSVNFHFILLHNFSEFTISG